MAAEFDSIAGEWNANRNIPSATMQLLLPYCAPSAEKVLDAGGGNARNAIALAKVFPEVFACDVSGKMLENAKENVAAAGAKNIELAQADVAALPYADEFFDTVFSFAVLHHLETPARRLKAFKEMSRVLCRGGRALIAVWNKEQNRFSKVVGRDVVLKSFAGKKGDRFYHFFDEGELNALAEKAGLHVVEIFYEKNGVKAVRVGAANLCCVLEK